VVQSSLAITELENKLKIALKLIERMNKAKKDTIPRLIDQKTRLQNNEVEIDNRNINLNTKSQDSEKTKLTTSLEGGEGEGDTCSQSEYSQDFGTESVYGTLSQQGAGTEGTRTPIPEESDPDSLGYRARKMAFDKEVTRFICGDLIRLDLISRDVARYIM
jgi:hypothetical protein